jgi:superfamily II DNA helicase RecQ
MAGNVRVVSAINALGMGVDIPDLCFVVHVQLPRSSDTHYQ